MKATDFGGLIKTGFFEQLPSLRRASANGEGTFERVNVQLGQKTGTRADYNLCSAKIRSVATQPPFQGDIRDAARQERALT